MHLLLVLQKVLPCHVLIGPQLFLLSTGQQCPVITKHGASVACCMIRDSCRIMQHAYRLSCPALAIAICLSYYLVLWFSLAQHKL